VWNVNTGQEVRQFARHRYVVQCVRLSADGNRALSGGGPEVYYWDPNTGEELGRVGVPNRQGPFALSADGRRAIFTDNTGSLFLWDLDANRPLRSVGVSPDSVSRLAWSSDSRTLLAVCGGGRMMVFDVEGGKPGRTIKGQAGAIQ